MHCPRGRRRSRRNPCTRSTSTVLGVRLLTSSGKRCDPGAIELLLGRERSSLELTFVISSPLNARSSSVSRSCLMIEWLDVAPGIRVIATPEGATRSQAHGFGHDPFAAPMQGPGFPETTYWLLEAAIALAAEQPRPQPSSPGEVRLAPALWAYRLCGYFHTTYATRRLLPAVARRFRASGRTLLASWAEQKLGEELGHDQLALMDLAELGYAGKELTKAVVPPRAAAWVARFEAFVMESDPVGCVGYAHALERLAL